MYVIEGVGGRDHYRAEKENDPRVAYTDGDSFGFGITEVGDTSITFRHCVVLGGCPDTLVLKK